MSCEWGYDDCTNEGDKCFLCSTPGYHYVQPKVRKTGFKNTIKTKETKRQGSISEVKNQRQNNAMLTAVSTGTPNSGAGRIKGDEQIRGVINIMEEMKTTVKKNINKEPGKESFTLQRAWLDKLDKEAKEAGLEFWYLKFSFKEHDNDFYIAAHQEVYMDMVASMVHDRIELKKLENTIDVHKRRTEFAEADNIKLKAEIDLLKAQLKERDYKGEEFNGYNQ